MESIENPEVKAQQFEQSLCETTVAVHGSLCSLNWANCCGPAWQFLLLLLLLLCWWQWWWQWCGIGSDIIIIVLLLILKIVIIVTMSLCVCLPLSWLLSRSYSLSVACFHTHDNQMGISARLRAKMGRDWIKPSNLHPHVIKFHWATREFQGERVYSSRKQQLVY